MSRATPLQVVINEVQACLARRSLSASTVVASNPSCRMSTSRSSGSSSASSNPIELAFARCTSLHSSQSSCSPLKSLNSTLRLEASGAGLGCCCCCCCCCCCRACAMAAAIMCDNCSRLGMVPPPASTPGIVSLSLCAVLRYVFTSHLRWRLYGTL